MKSDAEDSDESCRDTSCKEDPIQLDQSHDHSTECDLRLEELKGQPSGSLLSGVKGAQQTVWAETNQQSRQHGNTWGSQVKDSHIMKRGTVDWRLTRAYRQGLSR